MLFFQLGPSAGQTFLSGTENEIHDRYFVVEELRSSQNAVHHATETMTFVGDQYPHVDVQDFYRACHEYYNSI
jgi:hypothetical protein